MEQQLTWQALIIVVPLVFLSGLIDAIAGGGGLISLPAYLLAGLPPHQAVGTNKISAVMGVGVSAARYIKSGFVNWALAIPSAILAVLGASLGAKLILLVSENTMRYFLLAILPVVAFFVMKKRDFGDEIPSEIPKARQTAIVLLASLVVGMYDGFYGPGTGTFLLLIYTQAAHLTVRAASGNVKIVNFASGAGSLFVFLTNGQVQVLLGLIAGVAAIIGQYLGAGMVLKNGGKIVRPIIIVVLVLLFVKVISELIPGGV